MEKISLIIFLSLPSKVIGRRKKNKCVCVCGGGGGGGGHLDTNYQYFEVLF